MPEVFRDVRKKRALQQKRLNEMLEETIRQIKKARGHLQQKSKHVFDTTKTYTAKFEHELACVRENLRHELQDAVVKMEEEIDRLDVRMGEAEGELQQQTQERIAQIEASLGPIRDEASRLTTALDNEKRARILQEERREKMLADEVEAMTRLIDREKFDREQQLKAFVHWEDGEQQRVAKRQYQLEKETKDAVEAIRVDHQAMSKERISNQHQIIECIATFVKRYRDQMSEEVGIQNLEELRTGMMAANAAAG